MLFYIDNAPDRLYGEILAINEQLWVSHGLTEISILCRNGNGNLVIHMVAQNERKRGSVYLLIVGNISK